MIDLKKMKTWKAPKGGKDQIVSIVDVDGAAFDAPDRQAVPEHWEREGRNHRQPGFLGGCLF